MTERKGMMAYPLQWDPSGDPIRSYSIRPHPSSSSSVSVVHPSTRCPTPGPPHFQQQPSHLSTNPYVSLQPYRGSHVQPQHHHPHHPPHHPPSWRVPDHRSMKTPSPQSYMTVHDKPEASPSTPRKHSSKRRRRVKKRGYFPKILCVEEMKKLVERGSKLPLWNTLGGRKYQPRNQYEFYDGPRLVSVDSSEEDWNMPPNHPDDLLPARPGPNRHRDADEFGITARDLIPWLSSVMELCCCSERQTKHHRALVRPRGEVQAAGPQLETVCLDCGAVLEHHTMPPDLRRDIYNQNYDLSRLKAPHVSTTDSQFPTFEGYRNWEVGGGVKYYAKNRHQEDSRVPLPTFLAGPTRVFKNTPDLTSSHRRTTAVDSDYHAVDEVGRVALPSFPEESTGIGRR